MKKLILTLAVIAMASLLQAASFKWTTATLYAPNKDGTISTTKASDATGTWLATITLYADEACQSPISGLTGNSSSTVNALGSSMGGTFGGATFTFDNKTMYYGILEMSYTSDAGTQTLKTGVVSTALKTTGNTTLNFSTAISSASWSAASSPVPEPTSAMLLLLGFAGLALKRKNA